MRLRRLSRIRPAPTMCRCCRLRALTSAALPIKRPTEHGNVHTGGPHMLRMRMRENRVVSRACRLCTQARPRTTHRRCNASIGLSCVVYNPAQSAMLFFPAALPKSFVSFPPLYLFLRARAALQGLLRHHLLRRVCRLYLQRRRVATEGPLCCSQIPSASALALIIAGFGVRVHVTLVVGVLVAFWCSARSGLFGRSCHHNVADEPLPSRRRHRRRHRRGCRVGPL